MPVAFGLTRARHNGLIRASRAGPGAVQHAQVAQSVEQRIENPRVGSSILPLGTIDTPKYVQHCPQTLLKPAPNQRLASSHVQYGLFTASAIWGYV